MTDPAPNAAPRARDGAPSTSSDENQLFRLLVESTEEYAIFRLTPEGRIATWNRGAQRIKGYTAEEIIGESFERFYTEPDVRRRHPAHELEIAKREGRYSEEGWRVRKDGSLFWASVTITALFDEDGVLQGFGKVTRDMTERRAAERRLEERTEALERANRDLEQFAYVASHDLSEPLRTISGFSGLIQSRYQDVLDDDGRQWLQYIGDASLRLQNLIEALLAYSRVGSRPVARRRVDCRELLEHVREDLAATLTDTHGEIAIGDLPTVEADPVQLEQVFRNLISNGLKFVPPDRTGRVDVSAHREDRGWRFEVADNGIGVEPRHADQIFGVFKRLHTRDEYVGAGIGLAVCRRAIERHGGRIWVEPREGGGSVFAFTIPDTSPA